MNFLRYFSHGGTKAQKGIGEDNATSLIPCLRASVRAIGILIFLMLASGLCAQDFGFGFDDDDGGGSSSPSFSVKLGGEIGAQFLGYVYDFQSAEKAKLSSLGDVLSGALNFSAAGANVDAHIGLNLSAAIIESLAEYGTGSPVYTPLILDEAYLRTYFGPVNIEAGLRKLTWGKADSLGPLDVINPLDNTDLTNITDLMGIKIARPLVRVTWNTGDFSKLEAVFMPGFAGQRFAQRGRWTPSQLSTTRDLAAEKIYESVREALDPIAPPGFDNIAGQISESIYSQFGDDFTLALPPTDRLEYFQTGLRFTATVGSADIGAQYFYGNLFQPDVTFFVDDFVDDLMEGNAELLALLPGFPANILDILAYLPDLYIGDADILYKFKYNRYHQIGIDYAQVLFGFNVRGEFAAFITEDLHGRDGSVRNPFLGWSLGFDRDLFWGISANVQCNEIIRLLHSRVGSDPLLDCEAGTSATSTRMTMHLSKKFLKDQLECKVIAIWGIEDMDCYLIPAVTWAIKDITAEIAAGVFAGDITGDLGQYRRNSFVKIGMKYTF